MSARIASCLAPSLVVSMLAARSWFCALGLLACDRGYHVVHDGEVDPAALCETAAPGDESCPPCSTAAPRPDGAPGCQDVFYAAAFRCDARNSGPPSRAAHLLPDRAAAPASCGDGAACVDGFCVRTDANDNGLDDTFEREIAERNMPELRMHPEERCAGPRGIVYRVQRHPGAPHRAAITYVVLYDRDCGLKPHTGDRETFAVTVDLDVRPGAAAAVAVQAVAHRNTPCESVATCETRAGTSACAPPGHDRLVVYASANKHAHYLDRAVCSRNCFDDCDDGPVMPPRLLNVGAPEAPMCRDLSAQSLILAGDGWDPSLLDHDPWSTTRPFGAGGLVRSALVEILAPAGL